MKRKREILKKNKYLINIIIRLSTIFPRTVHKFLFKLVRNQENYLAMFVRYVCVKNCAKTCGDNVAIFSNVYLFNMQNLELGDNVSIHPMCYIDASGGIQIGNDVSVAHACTILSEEHIYTALDRNIKDQGVRLKATTVSNNVWVGAGARILAGCYLEEGSIIASGAVVKNKVKGNTIVGGVPAKFIKERG